MAEPNGAGVVLELNDVHTYYGSIHALKGIDGEVTRESVTAALLGMKPITNPLAGSPYVFGEAQAHSPMQATKVMKLDKGAWKVETPDWVVLPAVQ